MTDSDRVMPGDDDFRLDVLFERLRVIDYAGAVSLELIPDLWRCKPEAGGRGGAHRARASDGR